MSDTIGEATRAAKQKAAQKWWKSEKDEFVDAHSFYGGFDAGVEHGRKEAIDLAECMGMEFKEGALFNTRADRAETKLEAVRQALAAAVKEADGDG